MENDKAKIVKVKKNQDGDITDVMTNNGNVYSIDEAIMMARDRTIENVNVGKTKNGWEYLSWQPPRSPWRSPLGQEQDSRPARTKTCSTGRPFRRVASRIFRPGTSRWC